MALCIRDIYKWVFVMYGFYVTKKILSYEFFFLLKISKKKFRK